MRLLIGFIAGLLMGYGLATLMLQQQEEDLLAGLPRAEPAIS